MVRLDGTSTGARILHASGMDAVTAAFRSALHAATSVDSACGVVAEHGCDLWNLAVGRAHGTAAVDGTLPGGDDRPLYWARLSMAAALREWEPRFTVVGPARSALLRDLAETLELTSRGMTATAFGHNADHADDPDVVRVFVSGFDPFNLGADGRRGNPSGAAALALHGRQWTGADGRRYRARAVVFPVRFADFDGGLVERVFRPVLAAAPEVRPHLYATVSEGRPDRFDLEVHNGRRRSASARDNDGVVGGGSRHRPVEPAALPDGPEFVPTTLPTAAMAAGAGDRPFPVWINTEVVEIPAGGATAVTRVDGPTPGSTAVAGGGGGYLSNEIAYRVSLLRDLLGTGVPGGHIHTPALVFAPGGTAALTDSTFERNRADIAGQVRLLVESAGVGPRRGPRDPA